MKLTPGQIEWLALIRYQATTADEQSRKVLPLAMLAINTLHDAAESMLGLVLEFHRLPEQKNTDFMGLFAAVAGEVEGLDHHRGRLRNLNNARREFKHHSAFVDQRTIERMRGHVFDFLDDAARLGLGEDFDAVGLTSLVAVPEVRAFLESAQARWEAGEHHETLADLRRAFDCLINTYEDSKMWHPTRSLFDTKPDSPSLSAARLREQAALGMFSSSRADYAEKWLEALDGRVKLLAMGVDLRRYAYFNAHVPDVIYMREDRQGRMGSVAHLEEPTRPAFDRCQHFVIETALQLAADDFTFDGWAVREQRQRS